MIEQLNTIADAWWGWMSAMFWQVGLLIVVIAGIDRLVRRWAWPQLRYALWSLVLIKLMLPPTLSLPSSIVPTLRPAANQALQALQPKKRIEMADSGLALDDFTCSINTSFPIRTPVWTRDVYVGPEHFDRSPSSDRRSRPEASLEAVTLPPSPPLRGAAFAPAQAENTHNPKLAWSFHAMAIWFAGTLILGIWLLLRLHALAGRNANRAAAASLPQSFYNQMAGCAARLGLRRVPRVVVVRKLATPAVFGVFRPVLLMPKGYLRHLSRRDTEHMLLHELAHIKRGDLYMHGLYMLLQIIYWYNPLLWLVRRQLHHLRELSCDATVASLLREQTLAYRQTLLDTARRFLARSTEPGLGLLGLFEDANRLAVRLRWLQRPTWRYKTMKRITVLALAALMFACVLPMAQGQDQAPAVTEAKAPEHQQTDDPQLQELKIKLEKLEIERQELNKQLQALAQTRQAAAAAKMQSVKAKAEAEKAKDAAAEAKIKAKEAKDEATKAKHAQMNTNEHQQWAADMEAWAKQMQEWHNGPEMHQWQQNVEHWQHSDEFKQWEKDVQKWSEKLAQQRGDANADADAGSADAAPVAPMPAMPPMPALPAMPVAPTHMAPPAVPHPMPMPMPMPHINVKHDDDNKAKAEETMNFSSPLTDSGLLIVENRVGGITVTGGDTDECRIEVTVTARAETEAEAQAIAQAVDMEYDSSDSRIFIKPIKPDNDNWEGIDVAFEITVPRRVSLQLAADVGAFHLRDIQGQTKVKSNVGAIIAENLRGDVDLATNVGDVQFVAPEDLSAKVNASTNIGAIKSDLPIKVSGNKAQAGRFGPALGNTASGTLGTGEGTVQLKSNVGSISIR